MSAPEAERAPVLQEWKFVAALNGDPAGPNSKVAIVRYMDTLCVKKIPQKESTPLDYHSISFPLIIFSPPSPNIASAYFVYQCHQTIMEYCEKGELLNLFLPILGEMPIAYVALYFRQLIEAIPALAPHRRIKMENLLLDGNFTLKIDDFEVPRATKPTATANSTFGTPGYTAPEIRQGMIPTPKSDVWLAGALLLAMLASCAPAAATCLINPSPAGLPAAFWALVELKWGPELRDLLQRMLDPNPVTRWSFQQVARHPWLQPGHCPAPATSSPVFASFEAEMRGDMQARWAQRQRWMQIVGAASTRSSSGRNYPGVKATHDEWDGGNDYSHLPVLPHDVHPPVGFRLSGVAPGQVRQALTTWVSSPGTEPHPRTPIECTPWADPDHVMLAKFGIRILNEDGSSSSKFRAAASDEAMVGFEVRFGLYRREDDPEGAVLRVDRVQGDGMLFVQAVLPQLRDFLVERLAQ
ncbi:putative CBL-interacting serine/threonine-protein kinase 10 [Paratrimastix pyriformis]|uniref:non-specific serine/threonine protein kinase n=1 Tax=Paratrimastix pyriformis TaxID=342808 RepID=A0ABQ8UNR1_9EUKA|nr:putative CBL-interacting serine/threonine-protein kinase 10 [Paratrimastix pyriformis]